MSPLKQDGRGGLTPAQIMGFGAMIVVVISQGSGLALGSALQSFQGSFSIVLVGTVIVTIVTILKNGMRESGLGLSAAVSSPDVWRRGRRSLRWSLFSKVQKESIYSLAVTSALINLGGVVAVRELGNGVNAAFSTAGALAAGALLLRFAPQWLLRVAVLTAVAFAALGAGQGHLSLIGLVAALCAASHMWNLPKRVVRLGDKSDEGLTVANLISAPFVLIGTFLWDHFQGVSWEWGGKEIFGAVCAGLLVMVIPVFLQNWAGSRGVSEQDMGALASLSSPLHAAVGVVLAPVTLALTGKEPVLPTLNQWGFFLIVAVLAVMAPQMPKDNRWRARPAGPDVAVREDDEDHEPPQGSLDEIDGQPQGSLDEIDGPQGSLDEIDGPQGSLDEIDGQPQGSLDEVGDQPSAPLVEPKNPWVRGPLREEPPAWAVAQGVGVDPDDGKLILTPRGRTELTASGVQYPDGCGLTYRKGNLSVEVGSVTEGRYDAGVFIGLRASGITVDIGGTEMSYSDAETFSVDLSTGKFHVIKPGVVFFGGLAAE